MKKKLFTLKDEKAIDDLFAMISKELDHLLDDIYSLQQVYDAIKLNQSHKDFIKAMNSTLKNGSFVNRHPLLKDKAIAQLRATYEKLTD